MQSTGQPRHDRRIANRLTDARRRGFVGRQHEVSLFWDALTGNAPPAVLYVHGAGGVGKTTLLREFERIATSSGRPVIALDARHIRPSRRGVLQALSDALGTHVAHAQSIPVPDRSVVLIDTFERLSVLDAWIRDAILPSLPSGAIVVLAGREAPAREWSVDVAWSPLTRIIELKNFSAGESTAFLTARGISAPEHAAVLDFTHGHPLALSLVADAISSSGGLRFDAHEAPEVVSHLLALFLEAVPDEFRDAVDVLAIARVTSERLLTTLLGDAGGRRAFDWLRDQSFVDSRGHGLFPHDLAREVLLADLRWRDSQRHRQIVRRIYSAIYELVAEARGVERQRLQMDALYVTRSVPTNFSFFDWRSLDDVYVETAEKDDGPWIRELVERHEGPESADLAREWLAAQPDAFHVFHDAAGVRLGFLALLELTRPGAKAVRDPAVASAAAFIARYAPVGPGESAVHLRWWMHADEYQAVTAAINLTAMHVVSHCVTRPEVVWNFVTMRDPAFWSAHFQGVNFARVPEADFEVGGRRYGVFAHEWRIDPPADWLIDRRTPMPFGVPAGASNVVSPPVLGEADFMRAVRDALRDYTRLDALAENPLRFSRVLAGERDPRERALLLQRLLREAAESLDANPRDQKLSRVVRHTYIEPLATQELAAERLGLPFSTYRHQLGRAIERIGGWLWLRETALSRR